MVKGDGWRLFAGTVLGIAGLMRFVDSLWAFRYDGALPDEAEAALFGTSLSTYGWVYLVVAIVLIASSFGVIRRSQLSRWIGIFAGGVMALSGILSMPFYPVWALVYIALAVMVMYALCVYGAGDETEDDQTLAEAQAAAISRQM